MNEEQIIEKIKESIKHQIGNQPGGSGHLSNVTISNIKIEETEETIRDGKTVLRVMYSYAVDIESEFTIAKDNKPDPYNPYHYRKKDEAYLSI